MPFLPSKEGLSKYYFDRALWKSYLFARKSYFNTPLEMMVVFALFTPRVKRAKTTPSIVLDRWRASPFVYCMIGGKFSIGG